MMDTNFTETLPTFVKTDLSPLSLSLSLGPCLRERDSRWEFLGNNYVSTF